MKRFVMTISDKGGSGKSVAARVLADYYTAHGVDALLVDGDGEVGQLLKYHGRRDGDGRLVEQRPGDGVLSFALHGERTDREKIATVLDHGAPLVLCDFPAAGLTVLEQVQTAFGFLDDIKAEGYKPTFINPITPFAASMRTVKRMIDLGGDDCDYVVLRNQQFVEGEEDWICWTGSDDGSIKPSSGRKVLADAGGIELDMPRLRAGAMALIDEFSLTFEAACSDTRLPRYHRKYAQIWRKGCHETLNTIKDRLGVEG
ncbi:MAG: hypothetical protein Q8J72_08935 [Rhodocyclaceae bacterium]|nr:hypothetical protein [Rhodocyclaceae bacterium]